MNYRGHFNAQRVPHQLLSCPPAKAGDHLGRYTDRQTAFRMNPGGFALPV